MMSMIPELPSEPSPESVSARAFPGSWENRLGDSLAALDRSRPGSFGVYVKQLGSGREFSFRGEERWYLASGVKLPIALEVLAQAEAGSLKLHEELELQDADKLD